MGLIVDTSSVVAVERQGSTVSELLEQFRVRYNESELGLSAVTVVELTHGVFRARDEDRRRRRQAFVDALVAHVRVYAITLETARLAGRIEGQLAEHGVNIAFEDLLIGATAVELGFGVATINVRHFEVIPGLRIIKA